MGLNELVPLKRGKVAKIEESGVALLAPTEVKYELVDASRYVFEYKVDEETEVHMYETDRVYDCNEFIDAEFEEEVSEKDYSYYAVAAASGIITGAISSIAPSPAVLEKIADRKNKDWDKIIVTVTRLAGFNVKDAKGAYEILRERIVPYVKESLNKEAQVGIQEILDTLSSHPTIVGLVFSIYTQYSGEKYKLGDKGIEKRPVPKYYAIGRNDVEKIAYGLLYWVFNLAVESAVSKVYSIDDMKLPKVILDSIREVCKLPIFKSEKTLTGELEKQYSKLIKKIFEKSNYKNEAGDKQAFNIQDIINMLIERPHFTLIANECVFRCFYMIKKFVEEAKKEGITSISEIKNIDIEAILPFNNRLISRMSVIASGCYMGGILGVLAAKNIAGAKKGGKNFDSGFRTEIIIQGVGRFVMALIADSQYWGEDINIHFQRKNRNDNRTESEMEADIIDDMMSKDAFEVLMLDPLQARALYSLEALAVQRDIEHTTAAKEKAKKQEWLSSWQNNLQKGAGGQLENYFIQDEKRLYEFFNSLDENPENLRWFYLMAMELVLFEPYSPLGTTRDAEYKKLHLAKYNYVDDQFIRRQTIISQAEIDGMRDAFKKYKLSINGNVKKAAIAAGVTTVAAVATGGLAYAFAPGIATMIAGEAVMGLHGAALTNASLAFVGGGSIASGGLGMAGGTAIITGGGTILGVAGSGSASMAAVLTQTSSEYWVRQTSKFLVLCKKVLIERIENKSAVKELLKALEITIRDMEHNIKEIEQEKCSLDKESIKASKENMKYLNRCKAELEKMLK